MRYKISKQILWRIVDEEVVIVNPESEDYSYLNCSGKEIWQMLVKGYAVDEIVENLCQRYDASPSVIKSDAEALVQDLLKASILVKM